MPIIPSVLCAALLLAAPCAAVYGQAQARNTSNACAEAATAAAVQDESTLCVPRRGTLALAYLPGSGRIVLRTPGRPPAVLETIPRAYDPARIDATASIRLLPMRLQPYLARDRLLYLSVRRSSPGDGRGYCGAGAEMQLTVVDLRDTPKIQTQVLVSSCLENIELAAGDLLDLAPYSVRDGRLAVAFSAYPGREHCTAVLDPALDGLEFVSEAAETPPGAH